MVDPDRRPTAQEIEELIDLVRRDPGSPAFIDLGEAYLSLGRPRDAIQVGNLGLEAAPDNLEGRVMLARAHAALHQWKEAQGELLRVVKVDRSNRQGFALLGEVLLRRSDFERAVPVLQHAQNLDPTSPAILAMLRRARAGQPLDPPPPVPQPIPPRGETDVKAEIQRSRSMPASAPPRSRAMPAPAAPPAMPMVPTASPAMPTMALRPDAGMVEGPSAHSGHQPGGAYAHPGYASVPQPLSRAPKQTAPPPMSVEGIKPRIISGEKEKNAAAASLRQSAAVGETYLNDLLTGGLLDVAGVRVPDQDFDLRPDRRWGRSTRRAFIFLFVVLVLGIGGGGTWYWWSEKQKGEAVARLQTESKISLGAGDYTGIVESLSKLQQALERDKGNKVTFAYYVEAGGLASLLYGEAAIPSREDPTKEVRVGPEQVDAAYKGVTAKDDAIQPGEPGSRELVIGKVAVELSRLQTLEAPATTLAEITKLLDDYLAKHGTDKWAIWLKGRTLLAAGDRRGAAAQFKTATEGDDALVVAYIDLGNLYVDDGKTDDALVMFKKALDKSKDHPLAILGQALAKAEASVDVSDTIGDLNAKFVVTKIPPRVAAYRWLALAVASLAIEEYPTAIEALTKSTLNKPPGEPRFWARVAWAHYKLGRPPKSGDAKDKGDLAAAAEARAKCVWYSKKPDPDPTVQLVDAGLLLASGLPDRVLDVAAKIEGVRPRLLRTYALLDLGKPKEALAEAEEVLKSAENIEAKILEQQARMLSAERDKDRTTAADALLGLARAAKSKLGRHALGVAYLALGDITNAKEHLGQAVKEISDTSPNPFEYRTHTALAEIALAENNIVEAGKQLDEALKANSGYFPTLALQARVVLRNNEPDRALALLAPIVKESAAVTPAVELTLAEALLTHKKSNAKDKDDAKKIITKLAELDKPPGVTPEEISRVAAMIDPKLPEELSLPKPATDGGAPAPVAPPKSRHRSRNK
ncbi:MAG TPA: tetratricopeptide repeat protein [Kofleriaceae bacterium]|nr:tetratricopeptide repeat protein [Kofleriaceae bacterium]